MFLDVLKSWLKPVLMCSLALLLGLSTATAADAAHLRLLRLHCIDPQDPVQDETQMRIRIDGVTNVTLNNLMKKGDVWSLGKTYKFKKNVQIRLFDVDPGPDDFIGIRNVGPAPTGGVRTATFNWNGGRYRLYYMVVP